MRTIVSRRFSRTVQQVMREVREGSNDEGCQRGSQQALHAPIFEAVATERQAAASGIVAEADSASRVSTELGAAAVRRPAETRMGLATHAVAY